MRRLARRVLTRLLLPMVAAGVLASAAGAAAPETSQRPLARSVGFFLSTMSPVQLLPPLPARPLRSPRPTLRPEGLLKRAMAQREPLRGQLCGVPGIEGEEIGPVAGRIAGCGTERAVRVSAVSGVRLSQQAVLTCGTAKALQAWVDIGLRPAVGKLGGGVAGLRVAAHYACRTRNNRPGAKISEHGKARAIDISEVVLVNGDTLNVLRDWGRGAKGTALRRAHKTACGTFGTTLGPGSDGYHEDHFHYDTARHRGGAYCR
ncbi:extensin family protein [Marinovum sp.]|uniref:extensin-like domain-containing protein n=1 Tax=Marinovum sp. TaxID=2024839 RepID=UPI002B268D94|nr:extensin family protein [Marinovum sp.]